MPRFRFGRIFSKILSCYPGAIAVNYRLLSIDGFACTDITPDTILHESTTKTVLINKLNQAFTTADLDAPLRSSLFLRLFDSLSVVKVGALTSVIYCRIFERLRRRYLRKKSNRDILNLFFHLSILTSGHSVCNIRLTWYLMSLSPTMVVGDTGINRQSNII